MTLLLELLGSQREHGPVCFGAAATGGHLPRDAGTDGQGRPGLTDTIHQRPLEDFQQSGCQLWAPGRMGNPSGVGERPNEEPAPPEPFLQKERKSRKGDGVGPPWGRRAPYLTSLPGTI